MTLMGSRGRAVTTTVVDFQLKSKSVNQSIARYIYRYSDIIINVYIQLMFCINFVIIHLRLQYSDYKNYRYKLFILYRGIQDKDNGEWTQRHNYELHGVYSRPGGAQILKLRYILQSQMSGTHCQGEGGKKFFFLKEPFESIF